MGSCFIRCILWSNRYIIEDNICNAKFAIWFFNLYFSLSIHSICFLFNRNISSQIKWVYFIAIHKHFFFLCFVSVTFSHLTLLSWSHLRTDSYRTGHWKCDHIFLVNNMSWTSGMASLLKQNLKQTKRLISKSVLHISEWLTKKEWGKHECEITSAWEMDI